MVIYIGKRFIFQQNLHKFCSFDVLATGYILEPIAYLELPATPSDPSFPPVFVSAPKPPQ